MLQRAMRVSSELQYPCVSVSVCVRPAVSVCVNVDSRHARRPPREMEKGEKAQGKGGAGRRGGLSKPLSVAVYVRNRNLKKARGASGYPRNMLPVQCMRGLHILQTLHLNHHQTKDHQKH